jgi:hypothetical protein
LPNNKTAMNISQYGNRLAALVMGIIGVEVLILSAMMIHSTVASQDTNRLENEKQIVKSLQLSDLCLVTESRHTRHISQPEPVAAFQDLPGYYDHFPSSTFLTPPAYFGKTAR